MSFPEGEWQETGGASTDAGGGPSASEERPPELRGTVVSRHRSEEDDQKNSQEQRDLHRPDRSLEQLGLFPRSKDMCTIPPGGQFDLIWLIQQQISETQHKWQRTNQQLTSWYFRRLLGWGINESFWSFSSAFWESKKLASSRLASSPPHPSPPLPPLLFYLFFMLKKF